MTIKHVQNGARPDASASACEETLELLGQLAELTVAIKTMACRGDDGRAEYLRELRDCVHQLVAEARDEVPTGEV